MNITLIGMAGTGKSTVGKELAKRLNYTFIDHDELIVKNHGQKLQDIINDVGESAFLKIEEDTVVQMGDVKNTISTPGGSIVYIPKAMDYLKSISTLIFLDTPFSVIEKRISPTSRGIIGLETKSLKDVYLERLVLYKKYADIQIPCPANKSIEDIVKTIQDELQHDKTKYTL